MVSMGRWRRRPSVLDRGDNGALAAGRGPGGFMESGNETAHATEPRRWLSLSAGPDEHTTLAGPHSSCEIRDVAATARRSRSNPARPCRPHARQRQEKERLEGAWGGPLVLSRMAEKRVAPAGSGRTGCGSPHRLGFWAQIIGLMVSIRRVRRGSFSAWYILVAAGDRRRLPTRCSRRDAGSVETRGRERGGQWRRRRRRR